MWPNLEPAPSKVSAEVYSLLTCTPQCNFLQEGGAWGCASTPRGCVFGSFFPRWVRPVLLYLGAAFRLLSFQWVSGRLVY